MKKNKMLNLKNYTSKLLKKTNEEDVASLQYLCEECSDFFVLTSGKKSEKNEAEKIFEMLPPNKTYDDKFVVGIFDEEKMFAFIDIIRGYEIETEWALGFLLISPDYRSKGIGEKILEALEEYIISQGGKSIGIVVQEQNQKALKFWKRNGFIEYDERPNDKIKGTKEFLMRKFLIK